MDGARFDAWARRLAAPTSRRQLLGGLLAGLAGSVGLACGSSTHGGAGTGTSHTPVPTPPLDEHALTRAECEARGGSFKRWGLSGEEFCQVPAADAGTRCPDGSMCSLGKCITTSHASPGGCQEYRLTFGCFATVTHGTVGSVVCVD